MPDVENNSSPHSGEGIDSDLLKTTFEYEEKPAAGSGSLGSEIVGGLFEFIFEVVFELIFGN